jgi:hypothetical protein
VLHAHLSIRAWGLCTRGEVNKDRQWRRRQRERAGKQYKSPTIPFIPSQRRNMG